MQYLIKPKTKKIYKSKKLNQANFGLYGLNDYQCFLYLISKIGKVDEMGNYKQPDHLEREHTITAKEFAEQFNLDVGSVYKILKRVAKRLTETCITLERPELFETWYIALCNMAKYNYKNGSLSVRFSEEILPYLAQVRSRFVLYNLKDVANFGSLYTTRLYELIQEYKDTGIIMQSIAQLRNVFAVGKKYKYYKDFKVKTFNHAVNEINSQYKKLGLKYTEIKAGASKKIVAIQFNFNPILKHVGSSVSSVSSVSSGSSGSSVSSGSVGIDLLSKFHQ